MENNPTPDSQAVPPTPVAPPPVITPPPPPPRTRKRRGWMIFAIVLLVLLVLSVVANMGLLLGDLVPIQTGLSAAGGPRLQEVMVEDHGARNKVAVIEVEGIISGELVDGRHNLVDVIKAKLERAADDNKVAAVVLRVDSPGGEVLASDQIYRLIEDFQEKQGKPVIASMGGLAASGGYYVSAPCRWIVANDLTITGSIGVIMSTWNYRGLMDKVGLLPQVYKSGKHKDMLSGAREPDQIPEDEKAMLQSMISEVYQKFKGVVEEGRSNASLANNGEGRELSEDWADYADGRILTGTEAYNLGFVDEVGTFDDAVKRATKIAGISRANVVRYEHIPDISQLFRLLGKSESSSVRVDLGMDMPRLKRGRLYFLMPGAAE